MDHTAICHEINRQLGWRLAKIGMLQADKEIAAYDKARLLKRRASYKAKNNGKGRPPKALPELSKEKRRRLSRFKFEVLLLDELLAKLPSAADALDILKTQAELEKSKARGGIQFVRLAKLEDLIRQFSWVVPPFSSLPSYLAWDGRLARQYLAILLQRQRARCRLFDRVATLSGVERLEEEQERARMAFLERVNYSNHLASVSNFARATQLWRIDVPPAKPHNTQAWPAVWRQVVDEVWREAAAVFDLGSASPC